MLGWPCTLLKVSFLSAYNWLFKKFCNVISIKKWKLHFNHIARDWFFMCITACAFRAIGRCTFLEQSKTRTPDQWILLGRVQLILMTRHVLNTVTIAGVVTEQCEGVVKTAAPKQPTRVWRPWAVARRVFLKFGGAASARAHVGTYFKRVPI